MKKGVIAFILLVLNCSLLSGQAVLEIEGPITIGNNTDANPEAGTMRWSGNDFEVWNGVIWASLTGGKVVGTLIDIDGNEYKTIRIGEQEWMTENLRVTKYNDSIAFDEIRNYTTWEGLTAGAWCWYDNDNSNDVPYGKLYNWYTVETGKICPSGWHIPSMEEYDQLAAFLGTAEAGIKMKQAGLLHWHLPNTGATNESGFTGLPGGRRSSQDESLGVSGQWWSTTEFSFDLAFGISLRSSLLSMQRVGTSKTVGRSIRCLKD